MGGRKTEEVIEVNEKIKTKQKIKKKRRGE
jgi:hypothetical protein